MFKHESVECGESIISNESYSDVLDVIYLMDQEDIYYENENYVEFFFFSGAISSLYHPVPVWRLLRRLSNKCHVWP